MTDIRAEIEQAMSLAGPIYDTAAAIDAVQAIVRERAAEAVEQAAQWLTGTGRSDLAPDVTSEGLSWRDCRTPNEASDWFEQSLFDRAAALRATS